MLQKIHDKSRCKFSEWVIHSMFPSILTTEGKPEVTMTIIHILKTSIGRKNYCWKFYGGFWKDKKIGSILDYHCTMLLYIETLNSESN